MAISTRQTFLLSCLLIPFTSLIAALAPPIKKTDSEIMEQIVDKEGQISDFQARLELVKALMTLSKPANLEEALKNLQILLTEKPNDANLLLPFGIIYLRQEKYQKAEEVFADLINRDPKDAETIVQIAIGEVALGYATTARDLFEKALQADKGKTEGLRLLYADGMMLWGDFTQAESIVREELSQQTKKNETDKKESEIDNLWLKLAEIVRNQERFEEAEQIYLQLFEKDQNIKALYELGKLKILLKNFYSALEISNRLLLLKPGTEEYLLLRATAFDHLGYYNQALDIYEKIKENDEAFLKAGKIYDKLDNPEQAELFFNKALEINPNNFEAKYFLGVDACEILYEEKSPQKLNKWGEVYNNHLMPKIAIKFFQAAIDANNDYFPAYMALASTKLSLFEYDLPKEIYQQLLDIFPCSYQLMLELARTVSASKAYQEGVELYQKLIDINPENPVPIVEQARVEMWDLYGKKAMQIYSKLLYPTLNEKLFCAVSEMNDLDPSTYCSILNILAWHIANNDIYGGYEELEDKEDPQIRRLLLDHFALYLIQKSVYLESRAEWFTWNKRPLHALPYLAESIEFSPGNETAIFEFAQVNCALGLCNVAEDTYIYLLDIDPLHVYGRMALEREEIRIDPKIDLRYTHWREFGRGGLSSIMWHRYSAGILYPITCRTSLYTAYERWYEKSTFFHHNTFIANGCSIGYLNTYNAYLSLAAGLTIKNYNVNCIGAKYLANFKATVNLFDYGQLDFGYERQDVITNYFGIVQGIQADTYYLSFKADVTRRWNVYGGYQYWRYVDRNRMHFLPVTMSWQFTEFPMIFKVFAEGEYRNTAKMDHYIFNGTQLVNIIHPYWTPQDYWAGRFGFQWHHDYQPHDFCGSEQRFYDIKFWLGSDTEHNDACGLVVQWRHEFLKRWAFEFNGFLERSEQWDAEGIWITINYSI